MQRRNVIRTTHVGRKNCSQLSSRCRPFLRCTLSNFAICCSADALMHSWLQLSWFHEGNVRNVGNLMGVMEIPKAEIHNRFFSPPGTT